MLPETGTVELNSVLLRMSIRDGMMGKMYRECPSFYFSQNHQLIYYTTETNDDATTTTATYTVINQPNNGSHHIRQNAR